MLHAANWPKNSSLKSAAGMTMDGRHTVATYNSRINFISFSADSFKPENAQTEPV